MTVGGWIKWCKIKRISWEYPTNSLQGAKINGRVEDAIDGQVKGTALIQPFSDGWRINVPRHVVIAVVQVKLQLLKRLLRLQALQISTVVLLKLLGRLLQLKSLNAEVSWIILVHVQNGLLMGTAMTQSRAGRNSWWNCAHFPAAAFQAPNNISKGSWTIG